MFNEFTNQVRDNIGAMPLQSRAIALMLIAVIVIGVGLLVKGGSSESTQYLFGGRLLSEDEVRKTEVAFGNASLRDYEFVGNRVRVPTANRDAYLRALSEAGAVPEDQSAATEKALYNTSPFTPNSLMKERLMKGKELDLSARIMQFPEVRKASVFYDSQRQGFAAKPTQSASVIVVPHGNEPLSRYTKKEIADLVRAAYAGMQPDEVIVTDTSARSESDDPWVDENDPHYRTKRHYEKLWETKIRHALVGYGPPRVVVDVELDPKLSEQSTELKFDANPTTLEESSQTRSVESSRPTAGGVPGVASNAYGNTEVRLEESTAHNKETQSQEHTTKAAGQTHTQTTMVGLTPLRASVLVSLRSSYYNEVWRMNWLAENPDKKPADVPPLPPAERERLRTETNQEISSAVTTIIPRLRAGDDSFPLVKVLDYPDLPLPEYQEPATQGRATAWIANSWQSIALVCVAIVALLVARGALKSPAPEPSSDFAEGFGLDIPQPSADELAINENQDGASLPSMEVTGSNLKDELNTIIETNPDAAANVLRGWLSDAA